MSDDGRMQLAVRTGAATLTGLSGLLGPDAVFAATSLQPGVEAVLLKAAERIRQRWNRNAGETLDAASDASGLPPQQLLLEAASDDRKHELLARALGVAQDAALREKRRALGRAIASGFQGDGARIDDELMFIRAIADLDAPHIEVLSLIATEKPQSGSLAGWSMNDLTERHPGLHNALPAVLITLESHGLIRSEQVTSPWTTMAAPYSVAPAGYRLLDRLIDDGAEAAG